jgi:PAS domain S-box-containing protein
MPSSPRTWTSRRAGPEAGTSAPAYEELGRFWSLSPSLLAIVAYDGTLRQVNQAWRDALGFTEEELRQRSLFDLVHPDDRDDVRSATLELTSGNASAGFAARLPVSGGGWRACLFSAAPAPDGLAYLVGTEFEERRAATRLLAAEGAVAALLGEAARVEEMVPRLLRILGEELDWDVVSWWEVDARADTLRAVDSWHRLGNDSQPVLATGQARALARGVDLPGRVWATGQATWEEDSGTAVALPVGTNGKVTGVLELGARDARPADPQMLVALRAIGGQVAQFVERVGAETARRLFVGILESIPEGALAMDAEGVILTANSAVEQLYGFEPDELVGRPITMLVPDEAAAGQRELLQRIMAGDVVEDLETRRVAKDGTPIDVAVTLAPMRDAAGKVTAVAAIHVDVRDRRARDTALEHALRRLSASTEVLLALGGRTDAQRVLGLIAERGRTLVDARAVVILIAEGHDLVVSAVSGEIPEQLAGARVRAAGTLVAETLRTLRLERVADASAALGPLLRDLDLSAATAMLVPLAFRGEGLGVLLALDRLTGPEFNREDESLMVSFGAGAATAVATTRSVEQDLVRASLASAEREHRRWARDLHDQTLQGLHGLQMLLTTALQSDAPEALRSSAERAVEFLGAEIDELRGIITDVRPATLDELGLEAALATLTERLGGTEGIKIDADVHLAWEAGEIAERLAPELEAAVYRVVQEALTNVAKHSQAKEARVEVAEEAGEVRVEISDDGVGFDPEARAEGVGLVGMRERVSLIGGRLELESGGGKTVVRARLPARHVAPDDQDH